MTLGNSQQQEGHSNSAAYSRAVEMCQTPIGEGKNDFSKKDDASWDERLSISNNSFPDSTEQESFSSSTDVV